MITLAIIFHKIIQFWGKGKNVGFILSFNTIFRSTGCCRNGLGVCQSLLHSKRRTVRPIGVWIIHFVIQWLLIWHKKSWFPSIGSTPNLIRITIISKSYQKISEKLSKNVLTTLILNYSENKLSCQFVIGALGNSKITSTISSYVRYFSYLW